MAGQKKHALWLLMLITWTGSILYLSLTNAPPRMELPLFGWDKFQHAAAYALLTLLIGRTVAGYHIDSTRSWLWALIVSVVFGGVVELLQGALTINRVADVYDLLADFIGSMCVVLGAIILTRIRGQKGRL